MKSNETSNTKKFSFEFLVSVQFFLVSFYLVMIWILQYFNSTGNPNLVERISFRVSDPPRMPPGFNSEPIVGLHHFGDWTLNVGWALYENCYQLQNFSCQQPPLGNWILRLIGSINSNHGFAYFAWLFVAVAIYVKLINSYMTDFRFIHKSQVFFLFILFTPGNLISLDRGSLHFMAYGLLGLATIKYFQKSNIESLTFLTLSVSLKPQLILVCLFLLTYRKLKPLLLSFIIPIGTNLILMATFPGNYFANLQAYLAASNGYVSGEDSFGNMMNGISFIGLFSRFYEFQNGWGSTSIVLEKYSQYLFLPGLTYIILVSIFLYFAKSPLPIKALAAFSMASLTIPSSGGYLLGWSSLLILLLFSNIPGFKLENISSQFQKILFLIVLYSICVPGFNLYTDFVGFSRHIPFAVFLLLIPVMILLEFFSTRRKRIQNNVKGLLAIDS